MDDTEPAEGCRMREFFDGRHATPTYDSLEITCNDPKEGFVAPLSLPEFLISRARWATLVSQRYREEEHYITCTYHWVCYGTVIVNRAIYECLLRFA